ncbi:MULTISPECIES: MFS transporter [Bordetella]|uniref:MFS transporter n=1 Tax=Bordetella genomosp. 7 TaxID=1416805 RepID=A0A261RHL9_9BORD|nr:MULTISPECIES: MFS transporter [Bordetella]OZI24534.1 MFS transporter [Bordetella genomosp. 7]
MKLGGAGVLVITLAIQSLVAAAALVVPVLAPVLSEAAGVGAELVGVYVALVYMGAMAGSLSAGSWVARLGAMRASQWGLGLCAAGLLCSLSGQVWLLAVGAVLLGLGYGPITPASSHLLIRTTPSHRMSFVFSIKQTGVPLGGVLAGLLAPKMEIAMGWRGTLLATALACLACAALAQLVRAGLDADRRPGRSAGLGDLAAPLALIFSRRPLALLAGVSLCFSAVQWSYSAYVVTYLHDSLAYTLVAAGMMLSVGQVAGVAGRLLWGWCADRYLGPVMMLAALALMMAFGILALVLLPAGAPVPVVALALVVLGAAAVGWNGVYLAEVARQAPPGKASLATGGALTCTFLGVVLGPPLFGAIAALLGGYRPAFVLIVIPALVFGLLLATQRRHFAAPEPADHASSA